MRLLFPWCCAYLLRYSVAHTSHNWLLLASLDTGGCPGDQHDSDWNRCMTIAELHYALRLHRGPFWRRLVAFPWFWRLHYRHMTQLAPETRWSIRVEVSLEEGWRSVWWSSRT